MVTIYLYNKETKISKEIMTVRKKTALKMSKNIEEYFYNYSPLKHEIRLIDSDSGEVLFVK